MTTPIEKATASIVKAMENGEYDHQGVAELAINMAAHFSRVLSEEVSEKRAKNNLYDKSEIAGYNQCRRDIGLED